MSGDRFKFWLIVVGLAGAAVYSFWYAFKAWAKNRVIEDTPTSRVRSAAQGYVELSGHGVQPPDAQNKGPLTGMPCTWWRYKIEERRYSGRSRSWTTVQIDTSAVPFLLDDGTVSASSIRAVRKFFRAPPTFGTARPSGRKCTYPMAPESSAA
jgi:hypothetical protein